MDEDAIVQKCQEGDLMAYRLLYERYEQPFLRTACRMLGWQQDAEDAVQEAFLRLHRGIRHYKSGSRFSTYFFRILLNSCYDILRKRRPEMIKDFDKSGPSHHPATELRYSIAEAIASLPDQMRICFVLFGPVIDSNPNPSLPSSRKCLRRYTNQRHKRRTKHNQSLG